MFKLYWGKVWGLGLAGELARITSEDFREYYDILHLKIFLGPLMIQLAFQVSPRRGRAGT